MKSFELIMRHRGSYNRVDGPAVVCPHPVEEIGYAAFQLEARRGRNEARAVRWKLLWARIMALPDYNLIISDSARNLLQPSALHESPLQFAHK